METTVMVMDALRIANESVAMVFWKEMNSATTDSSTLTLDVMRAEPIADALLVVITLLIQLSNATMVPPTLIPPPTPAEPNVLSPLVVMVLLMTNLARTVMEVSAAELTANGFAEMVELMLARSVITVD